MAEGLTDDFGAVLGLTVGFGVAVGFGVDGLTVADGLGVMAGLVDVVAGKVGDGTDL